MESKRKGQSKLFEDNGWVCEKWLNEILKEFKKLIQTGWKHKTHTKTHIHKIHTHRERRNSQTAEIKGKKKKKKTCGFETSNVKNNGWLLNKNLEYRRQ